MFMRNKLLYSLGVFIVTVTLFNSFTTPILSAPGSWSSSGSNIFYNEGNIGIGNNSPSGLLDVGSKPSGTTQGQIFVDEVNSKVYVGRLANPGSNTKNFIVRNRIGSEFLNVDMNNGLTTIKGRTNLINNGEILTLKNNDGRTMSVSRVAGGAGTGTWKFTTGDSFEFVTDDVTRVKITNNALYAREVRVNLNSSNWPDYVFDNNYNLMSLSDVEKYISEFNHLPNIPNATAVEAEGLSLGDMQRLQMEKIEELTLYTINQEKEINELKDKVNYLIQKLK